MKNLLIPIDGSEYSQRALEKGMEMAVAFDSNVTLLNVKNSFIPQLTVIEIKHIAEVINNNSEEILSNAKKYLSTKVENVETLSMEGDVASVIINYINSNDFDLVIMGSQGLNSGKIKGLFLGSTTNKVIHNIEKPILVIR
ncbi:hypothetical protein GC105_02020 [Alkalibaculum sp. M08DMB]|uniref:UspA domain-containing protein n=1 Tax=Alkalibaculum sporogenes TaxID=2655001 RepID=A0A6A7K528_9FIRM|nr:universal stress protein [Alkalibaculum sporogenes]MPW24569.1 hypothetical protein [Alkalibaculum sporogenes]